MGIAVAMRWLAGAMLLLAAALGPPAVAAPLLQLDAGRQPVALGTAGEFWIDATGDALLENVAVDPGIPWQPAAEGTIHRLHTGNALWIRFSVARPPDGERWYLEVPYPSVNHVTLHTLDVIGQPPQVAGDTVPVAQWPVPHRHPLLPLVAAPNGPRHYLLRVENTHSFSAPLQFVTDHHLGHHEQRASLTLGMYFGLVLLTMAVSLLSAVSLRDGTTALYGLMVGLMGLAQAAMTGLAGQHLWPDSPRWADDAPLVLPVLGVGVLQLFFSGVVSLQQRSLLFHRVLVGVSVLALPVAIGILLVEPGRRFLLMVPYITTASHIGLAAVVWSWLRGDRYAPWLLLGSLPVALGAAFPLARTAGLIPTSFWTMHGMQVGLALELPVLLVMLLVRSQHRREHARRVQGLARIDPATGLLNADVFHEHLVRLIARSLRLKYRSAILLVDITNIDAIRRDFGTVAAQELTLHVAGRLLSIGRDIDSVARLGDHRFGLLLEGPLKADEVAEAGPRVVARCLMPIKGRPLELAAQVQVAQGLIPMDGTDPDQLIGQLELLLASAGESKRAVHSLSRLQLSAAGSLTS